MSRRTGSSACIASIILVARLVLLLGACLLAVAASAEMSETQLRERLRELNPDLAPDRIRPAPVAGLREVLYGGHVLYITTDGKHLFSGGELIDLDRRISLTEVSRSAARAELLEAYGADKMLVFPATAPPRHAIVVVTDIDCPYCQKFHEHMRELNAAGVEVRYLLYPRAGVESGSYEKSVSVWCALDRRDALTRAKLQEPIPPRACANPVVEHMDLVDKIGVSSTPSIFLPDGALVRGYRPPAELLALLLD